MMKFRPKQAEKNFKKNERASFTIGKLKIADEEITIKGWIEPCDRYSKLKDGVRLVIYFSRKRYFVDAQTKVITDRDEEISNFLNYEYYTFEDAYIAAFDIAANMRLE